MSEPRDDLLLLFRSRIAALFGTGLESVDDKLTVQCVDEVIRLRAENKELREIVSECREAVSELSDSTARADFKIPLAYLLTRIDSALKDSSLEQSEEDGK